MLVTDLLDAYGYYQTLVEFVFNKGLSEILVSMGDTHLDAAKHELANLTKTKDVKSCLNRAISNLIIGMFAYEKQIPTSVVMFTLNPIQYIPVYDKWRITLVLLVTCLLCLGELDLAKEYLNREIYVYNRSLPQKVGIGASILIWNLSPLSWAAQSRREKSEFINDYEFLVFKIRATKIIDDLNSML